MSNTRKIVKVSKNRKKSWKKHCDINDVEEYLEDKRFDERIGGAIADKSDESLFIIEKTANDDLVNETDKQTDEKTTKSNSKLKDIKSNLKYFQLLEPQSKVEPILAKIGPKNRKRNFLNDDKKFAKVWPQKQLQYLRAKQESDYKKSVKSDPKLRVEFYDIWDQNKEQNDSEIQELIDYQMILKGSKPPKVPNHRYQKPTLLPSVEVPHSGQSYNPSFEDHQNLLTIAHNIEAEKIREENRLKRIVESNYVTKAEAPNENTWAKEMSHGLGLSDDEDNQQNDDKYEDKEVITSLKPIRREEKKTKAQRRKELLQKQLVSDKKLEKRLKSKANEIFKIKSFQKEITKMEKQSLERQKRRSERIINKLYKPKRISQYSYVAPDVELNLTEELTGSLRRMKTDGHLLEDRFKSLQRRNYIESRGKHVFKRKYKLKGISKKSCKTDF